MCPGTDIASKIDTPHPPSIHFIRVKEHSSRKSALRIILGIRRLPLQHDFQFPVTVQICHRSIGSHIPTPFSIRHDLRSWLLQRDFHITTRRIGRQNVSSLRQLQFFFSIHNRTHLITRLRLRRVTIEELRGNSHRLPCEQLSVTINIESHPQGIGRQITPPYHHRIWRKTHRHHTTTETFARKSVRHDGSRLQ